jgi:hypothetical protein
MKHIIEDKAKKGSITQDLLIKEIERIKIKLTSMFGSMFNSFLGSNGGTNSSATLMSNSPSARNERMRARLQKKIAERNKHK